MFLLFSGLYIAATVWVVKKQKSIHNKIIVLVIALLIPSADAIVGRIYLYHLCDTEGGLKVYRVVHGADGFMEQGAATDYWVKNYGYEFTEGHLPNSKYNRFSRKGDKIIQEWDVSEPKSKYQVRSSKIGIQGVYPKYNYFVEVIKSKELLSQYSEIGFNGGLLERFLAQFSDAGVSAVDWCTPRPWNEDFKAIAVTASLKK